MPFKPAIVTNSGPRIINRQSIAGGSYTVMVNAKKDSGEIYLYGIIGGDGWFEDGVKASQIAKDLKEMGAVKTLDVRINSEGGGVFEAEAIYTHLNKHGARKTVCIDGLAASAASYVAMVGDTIKIADGGFMMIHNAHVVAWGNAKYLRQQAALLDSVDASIVKKYTDRTENDAAQVVKWMLETTWFDSAEAVANGFADEVMENATKVAASISRPAAKLFGTLPKAIAVRDINPATHPNKAKVAAMLKDLVT